MKIKNISNHHPGSDCLGFLVVVTTPTWSSVIFYAETWPEITWIRVEQRNNAFTFDKRNPTLRAVVTSACHRNTVFELHSANFDTITSWCRTRLIHTSLYIISSISSSKYDVSKPPALLLRLLIGLLLLQVLWPIFDHWVGHFLASSRQATYYYFLLLPSYLSVILGNSKYLCYTKHPKHELYGTSDQVSVKCYQLVAFCDTCGPMNHPPLPLPSEPNQSCNGTRYLWRNDPFWGKNIHVHNYYLTM